MRRIILALAVAFVPVLAVGTAAAQEQPTEGTDADKAEALKKYKEGMSAYDLGEFKEAIKLFQEAYKKRPDPAFLFNIAQCHRKLGENSEALNFYRTYLRKSPDTKNRAEVEKRIVELVKQAVG